MNQTAAPTPPVAAAPKPPKAKKEPKPPKEKKLSVLATQYPREAKITVLSTANPKRAGSAAAARFGIYKNGMTVGQYLDGKVQFEGEELKGTYTDLAYNVARGFIKVG